MVTKKILVVLMLTIVPVGSLAASERVADAECVHAALNSGERIVRLIFRGSRQTPSEQRCIELVEPKQRYKKTDLKFFKNQMADQEFRRNNSTQPDNFTAWASTPTLKSVSQLQSNDAKQQTAEQKLPGFTILKPE